MAVNSFDVNETREITPAQLKEALQNGEDIQLIDVREPFERAENSLGGDAIPLGDLMQSIEKISKERRVVFYCKVGIRSQIAIQRLQEKYGYENLYNLKGGILAYLAMDR